MKMMIERSFVILACTIFAGSLWGCAGRTYLMVDYRVPAASAQLKGQSVQLKIDDQRGTRTIFSPAAAHQFPAFNHRYSLAWIMPGKERILAGEYDLAALFRNSFEKRLKSMDAVVSDDATHGIVLAITLKKFTIDLQNRKWIADISYQATLTKPGHPAAIEQISGNAERLRVIGRKGADMVISEIFTDVVNGMDLEKLFQRANLIL
jgi:hypothetical protein